MRRALRRERDQQRQPEPAADLARGVDQTRREPGLPLLGALRRRDRRRHDRHRDAGRCQHAGNHDVDERAAARVDSREQQQAAGHHDQAAAEHRAHAELADEPPGARGDQHDRQRHRQEDQAGVKRREAEHLLQIERADEPHRKQRRAEQQHDRVRDLQRLGQLLERDQRRRGPPRLDRAEHTEQHDAEPDRPERGERAPALQARFDDAVDEHHLADRQGQRAGQVERRSVALAPLGDHAIGDQRGDDRDRRVDQQHPAPRERFGDDPAEQHAGGAAEAVHRRPDADRTMQFRARRERAGDDRQRRRRHQRSGEALHGARRDQHDLIGRRAAGERGEPEQDQAGDERAALAEVVGRAPAEHQEAGERDRVCVDDPLQVRRGEAEVRLDRRQRDVDDAQVEDDHELRHAADDQQPAQRGAVSLLRRSRLCRARTGRRADAHRRPPDCDLRRSTLVGWALAPPSEDWSPPDEKKATERNPNGRRGPGEHARSRRLRLELLLFELDGEQHADLEHDADEHDVDEQKEEVETVLLGRPAQARTSVALTPRRLRRAATLRS